MDLLTLTEVGKILRVSRWTIYRWIKERKLAFSKLDGQYRFDRRDVERFVSLRKSNVDESVETVA
jgi:excisionase family DNA binding protein